MKKKLILLLSPLLIIGLISCGGNTSDEAKELLLRLLKVVGIPQSIVVNICQDDNDNGFCESLELQTKVNINKGDDLDKILEKVSLTQEGEFFLENYDSSKKILMEIQDNSKVNVNQGKFTFTYNPTTQELSVLQMMIDEGYLVPNDVNAVRGIAKVDDFYAVLFRDFEANLNTLGDKALSSPRSVLANMKEMASELLSNGVRDTLPKNINNCKDDQACIDDVLAPVSTELLITDDEAVQIVSNETIENKQLVANKTFYSEGLDEKGNKEIYSNQFNSDSTSYKWEVIEGTNKGETGTNTISIKGNTLTDHTDNKVYILLGKYTDFLLYEENNKESKFYFDLKKLNANISTNSNSNKSILGTWGKGDGSRVESTTVTFYNNGYYIMARDGEKDYEGQAGMERGKYTWNQESGEFSAQLIKDTNGQWGLNNITDPILSISNDKLTFTVTENDKRESSVLTKINDIENSILGTWGKGDGSTENTMSFTFYNNGYYIMAHDGNRDNVGQAGIERGTYTWNQESGYFHTSTITDTDGEWGFNDMKNDTGNSISINNNTLLLTVPNEGTFPFNRVNTKI